MNTRPRGLCEDRGSQHRREIRRGARPELDAGDGPDRDRPSVNVPQKKLGQGRAAVGRCRHCSRPARVWILQNIPAV